MTGKKTISRRDFLDGVAVSVASAAITSSASAQLLADPFAELTPETDIDKSYPPILTGMRGNHPGSFDAAHPLAWSGDAPQSTTDTGEQYDLIVVGGGLSGLAAALMFRRERGEDQRVLILDNHDDFGGHAKRNEFEVDGKLLMGIGGSVNLEAPSDYSKPVKRLLKEIGVDFEALEAAMPADEPMATFGGESGFFVKTSADTGHMIIGEWTTAFQGRGDYKSLIHQMPIPGAEQGRILKLIAGDWDYLVGLSIGERMKYLKTTSYHRFLQDKVGLASDSLALFDSMLRILFGAGGDGISVREAILTGAPGLGSVGWPWAIAQSMFFDPDNPYKSLLFPDGNASLARLMVRNLIPDIAAGNSMDDIAAAKFDYSQLDRDGSRTRIRLNSTAIRAKQKDDEVIVSYVKDGAPYSAKADHCILACYNSIIPYLCPELPDAQKEGLKYGVKTPLIWANVVLRNRTPFENAGAKLYQCPNNFFNVVTQSPSTRLADYQAPDNLNDPMVVFMMGSPVPINEPGQTVRDQYRLARHELLATPFSTFEDEIRDQLTAMFGEHGFEPDRDIEAITVNRWAHGYAYEYLDLDDGHFKKGTYPNEVGRKQFGRISIANSDAGAKAYLDAAIDQAWRAVQEQLFIENK